MQRLVIQPSASTLPGIEAFVGTDFVDDAYQDLLLTEQGDAHGIGCILVNEIRGAVERVNHPSKV